VGSTATPAASTPSSDSSGTPWTGIIIAVIVVLLLAGGGFVLNRRRTAAN
jgi:cobalamin biosynthesis Mg chelatase CobN